MVLRNVHCFKFGPGGNRIGTRGVLLACEELGDEVDVTIVRYLLEPCHLVEGDVLLDEIAIRRLSAPNDLLFSPAIKAIPDARFLAHPGSRLPGLLNYEILCLAIARVMFDSQLQAQASFNVLDAGLAQGALRRQLALTCAQMFIEANRPYEFALR